MEHRWGHRLSTNIPVRLRCMQSRDSGCRCLGCLENVSASGALIRTELGIRPAPNVVVQTLAPALGLQGRELPASIVRASSGELAVEWMEFASTGVSAVMTETMLKQRRRRRRAPDAHSRPRPLLCVGLGYSAGRILDTLTLSLAA